MKKKTKRGTYAGIVAVAIMFMLTAIPTTAINTEMTQVEGVRYQSQQQGASEEQPNLPPEVPEGTSSISCITIRRAIDIWHGCIFDVGFSFWSIRLRDGNPHWLNFGGAITVVWHKGEIADYIPYPLPESWTGWVFPGFDFYRGGTFIFPQPFYTAVIHGNIYKDMGDTEYESRSMRGYNYYLEEGLLGQPGNL
jgi:hypothetical protein